MYPSCPRLPALQKSTFLHGGTTDTLLKVRRHSHMSCRSKILIISVGSAVAAFIALTITPAGHISWDDARERIRAFLGMRTSKLPACQQNLRRIELSKTMWADQRSETSPDTPTWADLRPDFPDWLTNNARLWTNGRPICPRGGTYTIGRVGERPRCSIGGYDHSP